MIELGTCVENPIVHGALSSRIQDSGTIEEKIAERDAQQFLQMVQSNPLDVAVMALRDPVQGIRLTHDVVHLTRNTRTMLMLDTWCDVVAYSAYRSGATTVITNPDSVDSVIEEIKGVVTGTVVSPMKKMHELERDLAKTGMLTLLSLNETDTNILRFLCDGMTDKEIAQRVYLSAQTIRNRVSAMLHKTGKTNRTQLALAFAPICGLFDEGSESVSNVNGCNCLMQHAQVAGYR